MATLTAGTEVDLINGIITGLINDGQNTTITLTSDIALRTSDFYNPNQLPNNTLDIQGAPGLTLTIDGAGHTLSGGLQIDPNGAGLVLQNIVLDFGSVPGTAGITNLTAASGLENVTLVAYSAADVAADIALFNAHPGASTNVTIRLAADVNAASLPTPASTGGS